ncbi:MAG: PP2C family serine/threonine-protein phosphatase [Pseudomonadota bacterium]
MSEPSSEWRCGGASVQGSAHKRRNQPNQDAIWWSPRADEDEQFAIAVADGHGGPAYHRSHVGAQLALQALEEALAWYFDEPEPPERLAEDVVTVWRQLVDAHIAAHPLPATAQGERSREAYGTTLVCVAGTPRHLLTLQVGDGDLMLGYPDGTVERPLPDDQGLQGEQTYSLCMADAPAHTRTLLRHRSPDQPWPDFAMVATDGVSKSFVSEAAFEKVVQSYRTLVPTKRELLATLEALPGWLDEVSVNGSGDDASLCMASRRFGGNTANT